VPGEAVLFDSAGRLRSAWGYLRVTSPRRLEATSCSSGVSEIGAVSTTGTVFTEVWGDVTTLRLFATE
jgi:hypothetical protein